jgi:hypothetical protein
VITASATRSDQRNGSIRAVARRTGDAILKSFESQNTSAIAFAVASATDCRESGHDGDALCPHHGLDRIRQPEAAGGRKSQSTFHCRGAERSRQFGCAWASFGLLSSAVASVLSITRWNEVGIEAAMPARMGSLRDVAAIVIIATDTRTTSTSVTMRLEKCFVMI